MGIKTKYACKGTLQAYFLSNLHRSYVLVYVNAKSKKQRQLVYNVVQHCYANLIKGYDVNIFIILKSSLSNNLNGWCQHNHSNNFDIAIDSNLNHSTLIKTICHEMVHVKQGVKNELVESYNNKYCRMWKGVEYKDEYPWEIEAYKLEKQLFSSFTEQYSEKK